LARRPPASSSRRTKDFLWQPLRKDPERETKTVIFNVSDVASKRPGNAIDPKGDPLIAQMGFINHVSPLCTFGGLREEDDPHLVDL
jgi:hypothetical protein